MRFDRKAVFDLSIPELRLRVAEELGWEVRPGFNGEGNVMARLHGNQFPLPYWSSSEADAMTLAAEMQLGALWLSPLTICQRWLLFKAKERELDAN